MPCAQQILTMNIITTATISSNHLWLLSLLSDFILGLAKNPELQKISYWTHAAQKSSLVISLYNVSYHLA